MPKYDASQQFLREHAKLTPELRTQFLYARRTINNTLRSTGRMPGPKLVEKMSGYDIYEVRFAPNGRATFHLTTTANGEMVVFWRRIGDHSILKNP